MNAEELEALPWPAVVVDKDGDVWTRLFDDTRPHWFLAGEDDFHGTTSADLLQFAPLVPLAPATDSGMERLAALRKAVTG